MSDEAPRTSGPVVERVAEIDMLRGVAILGIVVVNMPLFSGPWPARAHDPWTAAWDRAAYHVTDVLFAGKFFTMFSFLFGVGLALQGARHDALGAGKATRYFRRRLLALLVIGLVHAALLSTIDILVQYAVLGMLAATMRAWPPTRLWRIALVLLAVPIVSVAIAVALGRSASLVWAPTLDEARRAVIVYGSGAPRAFFRARLAEIGGYYLWILTSAGWQILGMFALGLWAGRTHVFNDVAARRGWFVALTRWALPVGLATAIGHRLLTLDLWVDPARAPWRHVVNGVLQYVAEPTLCLGYVGALVLLAQRPAWRARLTRFVPVGRMALTLYVLQSVVMGVLFFTYGFGWFGRVAPSLAFALALGLYALQLGLATLWLKRFEQGPLERLWRAVTYGNTTPGSSSRSARETP